MRYGYRQGDDGATADAPTAGEDAPPRDLDLREGPIAKADTSAPDHGVVPDLAKDLPLKDLPLKDAPFKDLPPVDLPPPVADLPPKDLPPVVVDMVPTFDQIPSDGVIGPTLIVNVSRSSTVTCVTNNVNLDCIGTLVVGIEESAGVLHETVWYDMDLSGANMVQKTYSGLPVGPQLTLGAALLEKSPTQPPFPNPTKGDLAPQSTSTVSFNSPTETKTVDVSLYRCDVGQGEIPLQPPLLFLISLAWLCRHCWTRRTH